MEHSFAIQIRQTLMPKAYETYVGISDQGGNIMFTKSHSTFLLALIAVIALSWASATTVYADAILVNGDFEAQGLVPSPDPITGWTNVIPAGASTQVIDSHLDGRAGPPGTDTLIAPIGSSGDNFLSIQSPGVAGGGVVPPGTVNRVSQDLSGVMAGQKLTFDASFDAGESCGLLGFPFPGVFCSSADTEIGRAFLEDGGGVQIDLADITGHGEDLWFESTETIFDSTGTWNLQDGYTNNGAATNCATPIFTGGVACRGDWIWEDVLFEFTQAFLDLHGTEFTLAFEVNNDPDNVVNDSYLFIDNVGLSLTAVVPEPGTILLFGSGLLGLVGYRFRKNRKQPA